ncbi:MAG: hypothetical protein ACTIC1_06735 [Brevibacterium sp.]
MKLGQRAAAAGLAVSVMFGAGLVTATAAQAKPSAVSEALYASNRTNCERAVKAKKAHHENLGHRVYSSGCKFISRNNYQGQVSYYT